MNVTTGGFGLTINENIGSFKYITGLLNSQLLDWFMKKVSTTFHGGYFAANKQFLVQLPIRP
ncbi:MAG TPA: TaqI-like C-terminal specificity domain-containing protein, partial [Anaerolineales bacterium]|nr:TaqI-like C-terminal specificity domain-containing protein [Anaerolineales bacterium]